MEDGWGKWKIMGLKPRFHVSLSIDENKGLTILIDPCLHEIKEWNSINYQNAEIKDKCWKIPETLNSL